MYICLHTKILTKVYTISDSVQWRKFILFIITILVFSCSNKPKQIGIQPYGNIDKKIVDSISLILKRTYKAKVVVLTRKALPKSAFVSIKSPRYRADSLLIHLLKNKPDTIDYVLGITSKDISTTMRDSQGNIKIPKSKYLDWGVFGLGYKPGGSCMISTFRLYSVKEQLYLSRIQKIAVHEIGHNMGLDHCETKQCVMQDAVESIKTVDLEGSKLCKRCHHKIE